jgi:hypothetical protein
VRSAAPLALPGRVRSGRHGEIRGGVREVMAIADFTPLLEPVSIDERSST